MGLILIIVIAVLVFIAWNIFIYYLKQRMRTAAIVIQVIGLLLFLLFIVFLIFAYKDAYDVVNNFQNGKNVFVLMDGSNAKIAVIAEKGDVNIIDDSTVRSYGTMIADSDYESVKGDAFKLIIIKREALEEIDEYSVDTPVGTLDKNQSLNLLFGQYAPAGGITLTESDQQKLRVFVFADILSKKIFGAQNQIFMITQLKEGNLFVYKETIIFKLIKIVPVSWLPESLMAKS